MIALRLEYINRKGQKYYLLAGATKTGKSRYYLSTRASDSCIDVVPPGFEIYENPNGQVFLRKALPKLISDEELEIIESEIARFARLKDSQLDRKLTILTVYVVDQPLILIDEVRTLAERNGRTKIEEWLNHFRTYSPKLQFVLVDREKRIFQAQRYCYLGSIDDWIDIGETGKLAALAKQ